MGGPLGFGMYFSQNFLDFGWHEIDVNRNLREHINQELLSFTKVHVQVLKGNGAEFLANIFPERRVAVVVDNPPHLGDDHDVKVLWGHGDGHETAQRKQSPHAEFAVVWMQKESTKFCGLVLPLAEMENVNLGVNIQGMAVARYGFALERENRLVLA